MTWWKFLFLVSLILLVSFLIRLNYQLVKELGQPTSGTDSASSDSSVQATGNTDAQKRLQSLRKEVTDMKEKVGNMKGTLDEMKQQYGDAGIVAINNGKGEYPRLTCTPEVSRKQAARMNKRFNEWWSHSACPDQVWMENINHHFDVAVGGSSNPYLILDIGCNKGYTSADFLDALSPGTSINPNSLVNSIRSVAKDWNTKFDRDGGVCNDSNKPLNKDRATKRSMEVHCFEPSPATYDMLIAVRRKLMPGGINDPQGKALWHIHNKGLHEKNTQMSWHPVCASAVGDELCTIVSDGTKDAITVPVVTVDQFLKDTYPEESALPLVHMLKIDAEGLDPAVLNGATKLLTQNRAIMVMFEFNPGLTEGKGPPHGMWGKGGKPRKKLLEVTDWLDQLGYDCYLDTRHVDDKERGLGVPEAPALYRITGGCLTGEPNVRGWANVACAARKYGNVAGMLRDLATMV